MPCETAPPACLARVPIFTILVLDAKWVQILPFGILVHTILMPSVWGGRSLLYSLLSNFLFSKLPGFVVSACAALSCRSETIAALGRLRGGLRCMHPGEDQPREGGVSDAFSCAGVAARRKTTQTVHRRWKLRRLPAASRGSVLPQRTQSSLRKWRDREVARLATLSPRWELRRAAKRCKCGHGRW